MGIRKSYKRKSEFKNESEMWRAIRAYHDSVVLDLVGDVRPGDRWKRIWDAATYQQSHLRIGRSFYALTTQFNKHGLVRHELEKFGVSNRLVRAKPSWQITAGPLER